MMPTYAAWFDDVGPLTGRACISRARASSAPASRRHPTRREEAACAVHRMTNVYLVDDQPNKTESGMYYFVESLLNLFKEVPPSKPFKVKSGQLVPFWTKITGLSSEDIENDPMGVNPQAGAPKKAPPLSAPHFITKAKTLKWKDTKEEDLIEHMYRAAVEDGFNSLDKLIFSRLEWSDDDVMELASAFEEVHCPNVVELDLSWNDMRVGSGLDAIGKAMAMGALHSLQRLNLINCTAIKALPDSLEELLELNTILLDGCVQLRTLPQGMSKLASLKVLQIINCHALDDGEFKHLPSSTKIIKTKEEKAKLDAELEEKRKLAEELSARGTPRNRPD